MQFIINDIIYTARTGENGLATLLFYPNTSENFTIDTILNTTEYN
ncbi:hypothetical protein ALNOE001_06730 [Candidatus Methanobinarius endosymbioticus]|uniref:Uncharacterized protein n=1 Tax=Candidatus Methanobinarius endosymbioticus TaxID=2006182 RepID=A0A366MDX4_9EURY|nr:hypothetical protein ALNOE001_06730 [Candidatus Methanobinarius endosymbioticus]